MPLVLGIVTVDALMGIYPDEQNLDGNEKVRADIGSRQASTPPSGLSTFLSRTSHVQEADLCKGLSTLVAGQAIQMLETGAASKHTRIGSSEP